MNPYEVMGIPPIATDEDIKYTYRQLAKTRHPDKVTGSINSWRELQEAYEILGDPVRREKFDKDGLKDTRVTPEKIRTFIELNMNAVVEAMTESGRTDDPVNEDIKAKMLRSMRNAKSQLDTKIMVLRAKVIRATELLNRFILEHPEEGEDIIGDVLAKELKRVEADLSLHLDAVEVNRLAILVFDRYRYKVGRAEEQHTRPTPSPSGSSFSSSSEAPHAGQPKTREQWAEELQRLGPEVFRAEGRE